jgi:hypothetical protein
MKFTEREHRFEGDKLPRNVGELLLSYTPNKPRTTTFTVNAMITSNTIFM